jgi:hypothetical protein
MALLIKPTENKKIIISGTEIEMQEVYARLEFAGRANGKTLEISIQTYTSHQTFVNNQPLFTSVPTGNITVNIAEGEQQTLQVAHAYAKSAYEQAGYEVMIAL